DNRTPVWPSYPHVDGSVSTMINRPLTSTGMACTRVLLQHVLVEKGRQFIPGGQRQDVGDILIRTHDDDAAAAIDFADIEDVIVGIAGIDFFIVDELERADPR